MKTVTQSRTYVGIGARLLVCLLLVGMMLSFCSVTAGAAETRQKTPSGLLCSDVAKTIRDFWEENEKTAGGMATAVFDKNGIIFTDTFGYADKAKQIKVAKDQVFDWGSISKTLIWVSAMQLKEQGKLSLDQDIRSYLPEGFLTHLRYDKPITMLHLMNHTAGFDEMIFELETPHQADIIPLGEFLKTYQPVQSFEPGTVEAYSNWGAALAGYVIECIAGESYASYVRKHIFEPLKMENTALLPDLSDNPKVAESRKKLRSYLPDGHDAGENYLYIHAYPAGMCTSDINDLTIYARALADPGTILFQDPATYQEMITTTYYYGGSGIPSNCHGFWQTVFGDNVIGHGGNTSSCTSQLEFDTKTGVGMVVLTNQMGETNFNKKMVRLIMGAPTVNKHDGVNGTIIFLPNMLNGPFKLLSFAGMVDVTEESFKKSVSVRQTTDSIDKIAVGGNDNLIVSSQEQFLMWFPVILWITAAGFAVISLLVKLVRAIVQRIRRRRNQIPLGKWSACGSLLILFSLLLLYLGIANLSSGDLWSITGFRIWSISFLALGVIVALILLTGLLMTIKERMSIIRRLYNLLTVLMMGAVIYNILYWQLYTFWLV